MKPRFETNPFVLGVVALCCLYGWFNFEAFLSNKHVLSLGYSALGFLGGIGLLLGKPWARFPIYIITALAIALWLYQWTQAIAGGISYDTKLAGFFSILLTLVPPGLATICSYVAYKRFRKFGPAN